MATSDGISGEDWDLVEDLAIEIVNAEENDSEYISRLLDHLDVLEKKYGELPSILATRADYVDSLEQREQLLKRAYTIADERKDSFNQLEVSQSLSELYIEELKDIMQGRKWLEIFRKNVSVSGSLNDKEEYERIREALEKLKAE